MPGRAVLHPHAGSALPFLSPGFRCTDVRASAPPPRLGPYVCVRVIFCRRQGARLPRLLRTCFYVCVSIFSRILRRRHALLCRQFRPRRSLLQTMSPAAILPSFGNAIISLSVL